MGLCRIACKSCIMYGVAGRPESIEQAQKLASGSEIDTSVQASFLSELSKVDTRALIFSAIV